MLVSLLSLGHPGFGRDLGLTQIQAPTDIYGTTSCYEEMHG